MLQFYQNESQHRITNHQIQQRLNHIRNSSNDKFLNGQIIMEQRRPEAAQQQQQQQAREQQIESNQKIQDDRQIQPNESILKPQQKQSEQMLYIQKQKLSKIFGIAGIVFEVGVLVGYGLSSSFYVEADSQFRVEKIFVLMLLVFFAIIGYGLLLSLYRYGNWLGIATSVVTMAVSVQFSPIMQNLFFKLIIKNFGDNNPSTQMHPNVRNFWVHYEKDNQISLYSYRTAFLTCISFLTMMISMIGRLSIRQLFATIVIFNVFWSANFYLLIYICVVKDQHRHPVVFDNYGTSYLYLFGSVFGLVFSLVSVVEIKKFCCNFKATKLVLQANSVRNSSSPFSLFLSLLGTVFIFCTFLITYNQLFQSQRNIRQSNQGVFSVLFGLIGSVIGTFVGSAFSKITCTTGSAGSYNSRRECVQNIATSAFSKCGWVGYKEILVGTISGGVYVGAAAKYFTMPWVPLMIGTIGGIISGFTMRFFQARINKKFVYDFLGLSSPLLISSLIGSYIIPLLSLLSYSKIGINFEGIELTSLIVKQLIYPTLTIVIAALGGFLCGLLSKIEKDTFGIGASARYFLNDFGLFKAPEPDNYYFKSVEQIKSQKLSQKENSQKQKSQNNQKSQKSDEAESMRDKKDHVFKQEMRQQLQQSQVKKGQRQENRAQPTLSKTSLQNQIQQQIKRQMINGSKLNKSGEQTTNQKIISNQSVAPEQ